MNVDRETQGVHGLHHAGDGDSGMHHGGGGPEGPASRPKPTRPQLFGVGLLTVLALAAGVIVPANLVNLGLSVEDVGGAIMPPGMIMPNDTPGEAMREMAAVDPDSISYRAPASARGDQVLEARLVDPSSAAREQTNRRKGPLTRENA